MELYIKESWNKEDYFQRKYLVIDVSWDSVQSFRAHAIAVHWEQGPLVNSELESGGVKRLGGRGGCIILKNATNNGFPLAKNQIIS